MAAVLFEPSEVWVVEALCKDGTPLMVTGADGKPSHREIHTDVGSEEAVVAARRSAWEYEKRGYTTHLWELTGGKRDAASSA